MMRPKQIPLVLMLMSGQPERVHMALMTAAAGAAIGRPVTLFISKSATPLFLKEGWEKAGGADYDATLNGTGVADMAVLADALRSLDARFILCDASLAEHRAAATDTDPRFHTEVGGLAGLLAENAGGDWLNF